MTASLPVAYADLPIKLLQKLDLARPMLNDDDLRPSCTGRDGFTLPDGVRVINAELRAEMEIRARVYCVGCPLLAACDAYADAHREDGLWAGKLRRRGDRNYTVIPLLEPDAVPA